MGWHRRGNGSYFYRSIREGVRVYKVYFGQGEDALALARQIEKRRQDRLAEKAAHQQEMTQVAAAEQSLRELQALADLLLNAVLLASNCYKHHGQWRRRGHGTEVKHARRG